MLNYLFLAIILVLFFSCSRNPNISDFEEELSNKVMVQSVGMISLTNIEKTNGTEQEFFGQKT
jgi:hypothetical protein